MNHRRRSFIARGQYVFSASAAESGSGSQISIWLSAAETTLGGLMVVNGPSAWLQMALIQRRIERFSRDHGYAPDGTRLAVS